MRTIDDPHTIDHSLPTRAASRWLTAAAALVVAAACSVGRDRNASDSAAARALVGVWDARFDRTDVVPGRARDAGPPAVRGVLAFVPGRRIGGVAELPDPTNAGTFEVDFIPLGFDPRGPGAVPSALARAWGRDSVVMLLGPGGDRLSVAARGTWAGRDSLAGTWSLVSTRMLFASGTFTMTRHRDTGGR
jgi:hypothetical protein